MVVKVDYLVACSSKTNLMEFLMEILEDALDTVDNEPPEEEDLKQWIDIRSPKRQRNGCQIYRFSVTFNSTGEQMEVLIRKFSDSVAGSAEEGIKHLLKLNDPQLQRTLRAYGKEIFKIEMKLREALSLIFVDTYGKDFYNLLHETNVIPATPPQRRTPKLMNASHENEFFHLVFSKYKKLKDCNPIIEKEYIDFLASLRDQVKWIEKLRNCVAHNRSIPEDIIANYKTEKVTLLEGINAFLTKQEKSKVNYETETRN